MKIEKKLPSTTNILFSNPKTTGIFIFLLLATLILYIANQRFHIIKEDERLEMSRVLNSVKQNIDQELKSSYTSALTLGLTISGDGIPKNFDSVAAQLLSSNKNLALVQLVPDGVVSYIYPYKGNEKVIGLNLFHQSKGVSAEAFKAMQDRKMYFAGPTRLRQGWVGIVGRMPLFLNNKFWGFSAVVIRLDNFLKQAGVYNTQNGRYRFQLSKVDPETGKEVFFLPELKDYTSFTYDTVEFPDGGWKIYIVASPQYKPTIRIILPTIFGILLAALTSFLVYRVFKKPAELQLLVYEQASLLVKNELKFKAIFDQAAIGILEVDSNTGAFLQINDRLCKILGYTKSELQEMDFQSLTHPEDLHKKQVYSGRMKSGEIREFELLKRYMHKNGNTVWVNLMITPLWQKDELPSTNIAIVEDVTIRIAAERTAEEYQHRIEALINAVDGVVWESDPDTFDFTFISKKSEDILGYTQEEWLSSPGFWVDHIHPDDRVWVMRYCKTCTQKLDQHDFEYRMIAKDGSLVWLRDIVNVVVEDGKAVLLRGIMIDITKTKKSEKDLKHSFDLVNEQNKRLLNFSYIVSHNLRSHTSNIQSIATLIDMASNHEEQREMITLLKTVSNSLNETLLNLNKVVNIQTNINVIVEPLKLRHYIDRTLEVLHDQIALKQVQIENKVTDDIIVNYNPAYLESILLNFIFNAIRYSHPDRLPVIELSCHHEDHLVLRISDNGIGIDLDKHGKELFGMYKTFTSNPDSKGVGLFISKNQIDAMGGRVLVESVVNVGTVFKIYFR